MTSTKRHLRSKGIIAALLGLGLLGGYGTFALWSDSAKVEGGSITNGNLDITTTGTPSWKDYSPTSATGWTGNDVFAGGAPTGTAIDDISDYLMVPGDLVEYSAQQTIIATGTNMKAKLTIDPSGTTIVPSDLTNWVDIGVKVLDSTNAEVASGSIGTPLVLNIDPTDATGEVYTVVVRVGFDGEAPDQVGTTDQIDLTALDFTLEQVR